MRLKKIILRDLPKNGEDIEISSGIGLSRQASYLLWQRGCKNAKDAELFLNLGNEKFYNPYLLPDMENAVGRIIKAIDSQEKITIYGDYDVDGVTSTSTLYSFLLSKHANVDYFIPSRFENGYGITDDAVAGIADRGTSLIVTVDTGVTAIHEVEEAKKFGLDFVITDHHECADTLPDAVAVVNPRRSDSPYPFDGLAGVGVAFKLICAVEAELRKRKGIRVQGYLEEICAKYIDIIAIGTIADVMPLIDENRLIVSLGLSVLNRDKRVGIKALIEAADGKGASHKPVTTQTVSFSIAPRLNAAGRMESAEKSVSLLLETDYDTAAVKAAELCRINENRKAEEARICDEINHMILLDKSLISDKIIVIDNDNWHQGVIGIAATKISEKYGKPTILITYDGDIGKGSGRSVPGFDLVQSLFACSDCLVKFGGHELAAGLTVMRDKIGEFRKAINEHASEVIEKELVPEITADLVLNEDEITLSFAEEIQKLEPFGPGNQIPLFLSRNMEICTVTAIGNGNHTKMTLSGGKNNLTALFFCKSPETIGIGKNIKADVLYNLNVNEYMGKTTVQMVIRDIFPSEGSLMSAEAEYKTYVSIIESGVCPENYLPDRNDFAAIYRFMKTFTYSDSRISVRRIMNDCRTNYPKTRLCLDILKESGAIRVRTYDDALDGFEIFEIKINPVQQKINLEEVCLYKTLKSSKKNTRA